jgi:hypothetical protein
MNHLCGRFRVLRMTRRTKNGTSRVCHDPTIIPADSLGLSAVRHFTAAGVVSRCRPVGAAGGKKTVVDLSATSKI